MAESNGSYRSKYETANKYEQPAENAKPSAASAPPAAVPKPNIGAFQPHASSTPAIYNPILGGRRRDRRHAEDHIRALQIATQVAGAAEVFEKGLTTLAEASQLHELAEQRRAQIPAKIELENLGIGQQVLQARDAFAAAVEGQGDAQVDRDRLRQIEAEDFETTLAERRAKRLAAEARALMAEQNLARAAETAQRKADADLHKATGQAFEQEAEAETQRRRRDQERQRRSQGWVDPTEDVPADLRAPLRVVRTVAKNREWVDREIAKVKAENGGGPLTPDQIERIQQLEDAYREGESSIRRRGASDL